MAHNSVTYIHLLLLLLLLVLLLLLIKVGELAILGKKMIGKWDLKGQICEIVNQ